jgi:hypothetical protein
MQHTGLVAVGAETIRLLLVISLPTSTVEAARTGQVVVEVVAAAL